jgi:Na+/proline symporter
LVQYGDLLGDHLYEVDVVFYDDERLFGLLVEFVQQVGDVLVDIGDTAFGGFAQLAPPVIVALYWRKVTRNGFLAGVVVGQVVYVSGALLPETVELPAVGVVRVGLEGTYFGWGISIYAMLLGLLVTVVVSVVTERASGEKPSVFFGDFDDAEAKNRKT